MSWRKGEHNVYQRHDDSVHPPAQKSGEQAEGDANQQTDTHCRNANAQGDATAVDNAAENVSPDVVRAEEIGSTPALSPRLGV